MGADLLLAWCDWPNVENIPAAIAALPDEILDRVRRVWAGECGVDLDELQGAFSTDAEESDNAEDFDKDSDEDLDDSELEDELEDEEHPIDELEVARLEAAFGPDWQSVVRRELRHAFEVLDSDYCSRITVHGHDIAIVGDMSWGDTPDGFREIALIVASGIGQTPEPGTVQEFTNSVTIRIEPA